jgi:[ribosomal protein S5]-alanine N-acetyltransferase
MTLLKTVRLTLRPQAQADAPALFAILNDPEVMRFWNRPAIPRLGIVEELVAEQQAAMADGLCRYWTLMEDGDAIGSVDLSLIESGSAELGFLLRRDRWGAGLATEAAAAAIAFGLGALGLTRLAAAVQRDNRAAARVLEKNGFKLVESRPVLLADGTRRDCDFYLLTK